MLKGKKNRRRAISRELREALKVFPVVIYLVMLSHRVPLK
jgi:hypothetical protein